MDSHRPTLVLVTTVPQTFTTILKDQPKILNTYFDVIVVSSGKELEVYAQKLGVKCEIVPMRRRVSPLTDIYSICRMVEFCVDISQISFILSLLRQVWLPLSRVEFAELTLEFILSQD